MPNKKNPFFSGSQHQTEAPGDELTLDGDAFEDLQALADEAAEQAVKGEASSKGASHLQKALAEAQAKLLEYEKRDAEHNDRYQRLMADFANFRNRVSRDVQMAVDQAERKLVSELLPVIDNFERCVTSSYATTEDFRNGVALIHKQFLDSLRRLGVEEVELNVGDPFDAQTAEALTTTSQPELPDGAVAAIFERGFKLRSQLLRAARVVVNRQDN